MPSVNTSATQTAVIGTEHTLATITPAGIYVLMVDANAMASGDTLELRAYLKVLAGSISRVMDLGTFSGVQSLPVLRSLPVPATHEVKFTLKQTAGVGRAFDWEAVAL